MALAAALSVSAAAAHAAAITVSIFDAPSYNAGWGTGSNAYEDFESLGASLGEGEVGANFATNVGIFNTIGGVGSGGTVTQLPGNTGQTLALRDGNVFGRNNATPNGGVWFLDSNDTFGMIWDVMLGGTSFNKLSFVISDASDVGAYLRISTGTASYELRTGGQLANGNDKLIEIDFGGAVTSAQIVLGNFTTSGGTTYKLNDGFSIDGIEVNAVPLPAGAVLLLSALAGGAALRRRRG